MLMCSKIVCHTTNGRPYVRAVSLYKSEFSILIKMRVISKSKVIPVTGRGGP
jgi:hypothetical protein